jgi:polysaccharide deacetylase
MALFFLHGIVDDWSPSCVNRNYVSRAAFETHLRSREKQYGAWERVADVDHLSVDDSTRAGADACLLARGLGHEVVFFVNPLPVETGEPYFFTLLDTFLDARTVSLIEFNDVTYDLEPDHERRRFRRAVKVATMGLPSGEACAAVREIGQRLGAAGTPPPPHTLPVTIHDLVQLQTAGVRIENHGWSHVEISALDHAAFLEHVSSGRLWIQNRLDWDSRLYAVPFGVSDVPHDRELDIDAHFLARADLPPGQLAEHCWNRHDLTPRLQLA